MSSRLSHWATSGNVRLSEINSLAEKVCNSSPYNDKMVMLICPFGKLDTLIEYGVSTKNSKCLVEDLNAVLDVNPSCNLQKMPKIDGKTQAEIAFNATCKGNASCEMNIGLEMFNQKCQDILTKRLPNLKQPNML